MSEESPVKRDPVEAGRRGGIKSGETRRAKAKLRKDIAARQVFVDSSEAAAKELVDAALGRGSWQEDGHPVLDAKERLGALKTMLEYGVGRPRSSDPMPAEDMEDEPTDGFKFGVRADDVPDTESVPA